MGPEHRKAGPAARSAVKTIPRKGWRSLACRGFGTRNLRHPPPSSESVFGRSEKTQEPIRPLPFARVRPGITRAAAPSGGAPAMRPVSNHLDDAAQASSLAPESNAPGLFAASLHLELHKPSRVTAKTASIPERCRSAVAADRAPAGPGSRRSEPPLRRELGRKRGGEPPIVQKRAVADQSRRNPLRLLV
jgi:hypothetical protein